MALSDYDKQKLSAQQQAQIQDLTNKWNELDAQYKQAQQSGNTALADSLSQQKTDLHDQAQAIRRGEGYSGGADGSQNISFNNNSGKTVNEQVYTPVSESIAAATPVKDAYGNSVRTATKEASDATKELYNQQVQKQAEYVNNNPDAVKPFASGEFMSIYGDVYTTAPNGTTVKIKDLVDVGSTASYTYNAEKAAAAKAQGYNVIESEYLGKPAWYIEGVDRTKVNGTSSADESLLSDTAYAALLYERQLWYEDDAKYQEALAAGNTALAEQYKASRDQHHLNAERLRSNTWLGGYGGGTDGSMYIDYTTEAAKGTMPAYTDSAQKLLGVKGIEYTLPSWQQEEQESDKAATGGSGSAVGGSGSITGNSGSLSGGTISAPTLGSGNGVGTTSPTFKVNDYSQYIQDMYDAKREAAIAALEAAYQQNINSINRAGEGIAETYQNARNQTAGASELAKRNFAQYAAANGLNSGTGGQAELARNVTLQNNLNSINNAEGQSIADLELQRANADVEYNNAIAQAEATGNYELANALYQEKVRYETALNNAIQQEFQNAITNYQLQYQAYRDSVGDNQWEKAFAQQVAQQNWENLFNQTQYDDTLAQQDWLNNFNQNQYKDSMTQQNFENAFLLQQYKDALNQQSVENALNANKPSLTYSQVMSAIESGVVTPTVKSAFEYYNGVPFDTYYGGGTGVGTTPTGTTPTTQGYDNGTLTSAQVKEMQAYYGLTADGFWGPNSQSTTGMSANDAWAQYQLKKGSTTGSANSNYSNVNAGWANSGLTRDEYDSAVRNGSIVSSAGYTALLNELSRIEDSGRNVATKATIAIQEALEDGVISQALADKLFAQYGL